VHPLESHPPHLRNRIKWFNMTYSDIPTVIKDIAVVFSTIDEPPSVYLFDSFAWHLVDKDPLLYTAQAKEDRLTPADFVITDIGIGKPKIGDGFDTS
jgi:hypothetical protein